MKVVVVGLGIQGRKRLRIAGGDVVASVDPVQSDAGYRSLKDVALDSYQAALLCVPDDPKIELIGWLLEHGKHVLVEKPLIAAADEDLERLIALGRSRGVVGYTAYNHRFEPHFVRMKELIDSGRLGRIYLVRMFYGNGTARDVRGSPWRDRGAGVLPDLGSHLLDTMRFWLGPLEQEYHVQGAHRFENRAFDHVQIASEGATVIELEATLLSWRNHMTVDVYGEAGTGHIESLCKWGPTSFTERTRVLPSGRPPEHCVTLTEPDPTWELEYAHFKRLCASGEPGNFENDLWLNRTLRSLGEQALRDFPRMSDPVVGYAGMTHLGLCSAVAAAERGFRVVGYDADAARISELSRGKLPVSEPGLPELVRKNASRLLFTSKPEDLAGCSVVYVAADVPTDDAGASDLGAIETLLHTLDRNLAREATQVVLSQVPPGFTRRHLRPGRLLFYQVETLIFGRAVERALHPERFIVGCPESDTSLPPSYAEFLARFGCEILPMRYESAELGKIAINACLVASISVANTLSELCERIGARWSEIVPALRLDARIGPKAYLQPGLGIAGGNLERDLATICRLSEQTGSDAGVVRAWISNSVHRRDWALRTLHEQVLERNDAARIAVLGLAYKQDTHSTKNSPALALIHALPGRALRAWDPLVPTRAVAHASLEQAESALDACRGADALAIMTPWAEFARLDPAQIAAALRGRCVIDPYAVLDEAACSAAGLDYFTLGAPGAAATTP